jgi:hypothetical protein
MSAQHIVAELNNIRQLVRTFKTTAQDQVHTQSNAIEESGASFEKWREFDQSAFDAFAHLQAAEERLLEASAHILEAGTFLKTLEQTA